MKVVIAYESYHGNTRTMAYALERGAREAGGDTVIRNIRQIKPFDLQTADLVVVATPTYHHKPPSNVRRFMTSFDMQDLKGKHAFVLGSYEELGEAIEIMMEWFSAKGATVITPAIKVKGKATKADLEACAKKGGELAAQ